MYVSPAIVAFYSKIASSFYVLRSLVLATDDAMWWLCILAGVLAALDHLPISGEPVIKKTPLPVSANGGAGDSDHGKTQAWTQVQLVGRNIESDI